MRALGGGERALHKVIDRGVQSTGLGRKEGGVVRPANVVLEHPPSRRIEKPATLSWIDPEKRRHDIGQRCDVEVGLLIGVAWTDQRKRNGRPVHFRKAF